MATLLPRKPAAIMPLALTSGRGAMFEAVHAKRYAERMTAYLGLGVQSHVIEVASDDGSPAAALQPARHSRHRHRTRPCRRRSRDEGARHPDIDRIVRPRHGADAWRPRASTPISWWRTTRCSRMPDPDDFLGWLRAAAQPEGVAHLRDRPDILTSRGEMAEAALRQAACASSTSSRSSTPRGPLQLFACRWDSAWQSRSAGCTDVGAPSRPLHCPVH